MKGVVSFISHKDIPGVNSFTPTVLTPQVEEIFCSVYVKYNGQPIGLIVAETHQLAMTAAASVKVTYDPPKSKPYFTTEQVLQAPESEQTQRIETKVDVKPSKTGI